MSPSCFSHPGPIGNAETAQEAWDIIARFHRRLEPALAFGLDMADVVLPGGFAPVVDPLKQLARGRRWGRSFDAFGPVIDLVNRATFGLAASR